MTDHRETARILQEGLAETLFREKFGSAFDEKYHPDIPARFNGYTEEEAREETKALAFAYIYAAVKSAKELGLLPQDEDVQ